MHLTVDCQLIHVKARQVAGGVFGGRVWHKRLSSLYNIAGKFMISYSFLIVLRI